LKTCGYFKAPRSKTCATWGQRRSDEALTLAADPEEAEQRDEPCTNIEASNGSPVSLQARRSSCFPGSDGMNVDANTPHSPSPPGDVSLVRRTTPFADSPIAR
jgi:hypothetical protein